MACEYIKSLFQVHVIENIEASDSRESSGRLDSNTNGIVVKSTRMVPLGGMASCWINSSFLARRKQKDRRSLKLVTERLQPLALNGRLLFQSSLGSLLAWPVRILLTPLETRLTMFLGDILFKHRNHQAINSSMIDLRIGCSHHHQRTSIPARHCRNSIKFPTPRSICPKTLEKYTRHLRKLRERRKK